MGKLVTIGIDDYKTVFPMAANDWDYDKNLYPPERVYFGSNEEAYFICQFCGNKWSAHVRYHKSPGCIACVRKNNARNRIAKRIEKVGAISELPDIMIDWDTEENASRGIDCNLLTNHSNQTAYWRCHKCGYKWSATVSHRLEKYTNSNDARAKLGTGCPACAHRVVVTGFNDLATRHPELVPEWDEVANGIPISQIINGFSKNYQWKCSICGNTWSTSISNRIAGTMCPKCRGTSSSISEQSILYYIRKIFPDAINRYIEPSSHKEIDIYINELALGIEFDGYGFHRSKKEEDESKNVCLRKLGIKLIRIRETDYTGEVLPDISDTTDYYLEYKRKTKYNGLNKVITQILVIIAGEQSALECRVDTFHDRFKILHAMYCGRVKNSFMSKDSGQLKFWDYQSNNPLTPNDVSSKSTIKVYWKCPDCNHTWERSVYNQVKSCGCPRCNNRVLSSAYCLAALYPDIASEWDAELNKDNPTDVFPNSHDKRHWICSKCGNSWMSSIAHRVNGCGCTKCSRERNRQAVMKRVKQLDSLTGQFIAEYESAREASRVTGISFKKISCCCNGKQITAGGYRWAFVSLV